MRMHGDLKTLLFKGGVLQQKKLAEEFTELVSVSSLCHIRAKCKQQQDQLCSPAAGPALGAVEGHRHLVVTAGVTIAHHHQLQSPEHLLSTPSRPQWLGSTETAWPCHFKKNKWKSKGNEAVALSVPIHVCGALFPFN